MKPMLIKGQEKTRLTKAWDDDFQLATLEANITTSLFTTVFGIEKALNFVNDYNPT